MSAAPDIYRLINLMPASGRMFTQILSKPEQSTLIRAGFPLPWTRTRLITINFNLWNQLPVAQQDLLLLRTVSWQSAVLWSKPDLPKRWVGIGLAVALIELLRVDAAGLAITIAGLTLFTGLQVWRKGSSQQATLEADKKAIQMAQRRGYTKAEAASHLREAIASIVMLEGRSEPSGADLIRIQNLQSTADSLSVDGAGLSHSE